MDFHVSLGFHGYGLLYLLFVEQLVPALCLSSVAVLVPALAAAAVVLVVMRNCLLEMQLSQRSKSHWKQLNRFDPVLTIFPFYKKMNKRHASHTANDLNMKN